MNQIQALQSGFRACTKVSPDNFRISALVSFRITTSLSGIRRPISSSSKPVSSMVRDGKKDTKLKGLMGTNPNPEKPIYKENGVESCSIDMETFKDDPAKIEKLTVQELRTTLRSVGIPPKGRKTDLVSSLTLFLCSKLDAESSLIAEHQASPVSAQRLSTVKDAKNENDEDQTQNFNVVSEVHVDKVIKRSSKELEVESNVIKLDSKVAVRKHKLSVKSDDASGRTLSQTKRKVSSELVRCNVKVDINSNMPVMHTEPRTMLAHKKPQKHWTPYNPRAMRPPPLTSETKSVKLMSWNVNGLRTLLKLEGFSALQLARREDFDVLCFQETKLQEKDVEEIKQYLIEGYEDSFWTCSISKLGYSGTAIISRIKPLSVRYGLGISDHDSEGRMVTAEFDSFYLISVYVPNSGDGLRRLSYRITQWDPSLSSYIKELEKSKPVILTGDLNCAHEEIDIYNPAGNKRSAGFTDEERQSFGANFLSKGFVDTFRRQHPGVVGYTYWGYRHGARKTNKGWRLDYFLVSESIADKVHDSYILPDIIGSDHCPIGLVLKL